MQRDTGSTVEYHNERGGVGGGVSNVSTQVSHDVDL